MASARVVLKAEMWHAILREGVGISPQCEMNLTQLVDAAIANLESGGAPPDDVARAAVNLGAIVQKMAEAARHNGWTDLHETTLSDALAKLCPIFPFC